MHARSVDRVGITFVATSRNAVHSRLTGFILVRVHLVDHLHCPISGAKLNHILRKMISVSLLIELSQIRIYLLASLEQTGIRSECPDVGFASGSLIEKHLRLVLIVKCPLWCDVLRIRRIIWIKRHHNSEERLGE